MKSLNWNLQKVTDCILFNLIIVIPSFRLLDKFHYLVLAVPLFVTLNFLYYRLHQNLFARFLKGKIWIFSLIIYFAGAAALYPIVSKRSNPGSTGDDAIILAAKTLKNSGKLYDVYINANTPISPGPGWILLNSGFPLLNLYFLFGPVYILLVIAVLKYSKIPDYLINTFCLLISSSLVFWELLFNGHDYLSLSFAFFAIFILIFKLLRTKIEIWKLLLIGFFLGIFSTSRIVFIAFPFIYSFFLMNFNKRNAYLLLLISIVTNLSFNIYYYYINDFFQPLHIFTKAEKFFGNEPIFIISLLVLFVLYFLSKQKTFDLKLVTYKISLLLSAIFIPVAYLDLFRVDFHFFEWEGANYTFLIVPFFAFYLATKMVRLEF